MGFDCYHPTMNLLFFSVCILTALIFDHPAYLLIGWLCASIYAIFLRGWRAVWEDVLLLVGTAIFALYYSAYTHFGVTALKANFIGNSLTLEALVYGVVLGIKAATVLMWLCCVHAIFSSDKVVYLFGRVSPRLSLFLSIILRMAPRVRERWRVVERARHCIGKGAGQGSFFRRIRNIASILSIVVTWTLDDFITTSDSMGSRGFALRGRTAYSLYRFDNRDRLFCLALFTALSAIATAFGLDQMRTLYRPEIQMNPVSALSYAFYGAYMLFCLLPMMVEIGGRIRFRIARGRGGNTFREQ